MESVVVVWQTEPIGFGNPFAFGTCFTRCFVVLPATIDIGFVEHLKLLLHHLGVVIVVDAPFLPSINLKDAKP